jgi:hypothetical protein
MAILRIAAEARNDMLRALLARVLRSGPGLLQIYSGEQPADADTPLSPQNVMMASLVISSAEDPKDGTLQFVMNEELALVADQATFCRVFDAGGVVVFDGDLKEDGTGFLNFNRLDFVYGGKVKIEDFEIFIPEDIQFMPETGAS